MHENIQCMTEVKYYDPLMKSNLDMQVRTITQY